MSAPQATNPLKYANAKAAREQASESIGFMASVLIELEGGGILEIPNPSLLDPEAQKRYDQLEFDCEKLDRHPAPIDRETGEPLIGPDGVPLLGKLKEPHRVNGELVENYETRLAQAILGDKYDEAIKAGFYPSQLGVHWAQMRRGLEVRQAADDKSVGSDSDLGAVPETDSGES